MSDQQTHVPSSQGENIQSSPPERMLSIDAFRGFTIFLMVLVIAVSGYRDLPHQRSWFGSLPVSTWHHADVGWNTFSRQMTEQGLSEEEIQQLPEAQRSKIGCTLTDLVAPFFVFIVGVCIPLSRSRRGAQWWTHVLSRTWGLIAAGVLYISLILGLSWWWGILQAIGVAYLMGAGTARLSTAGKWAAVWGVLVFHLLMSRYVGWWLDIGASDNPFWTIGQPDGDPLRPLTVHCLPWVSISYGAMCMVGVLLGDAIVSRSRMIIMRQCLILGIVFGVSGWLVHTFGLMTGNYDLCFNKPDVTSSYAMFTSGIGALTFLVFYWVMDVWKVRGWAAPFMVLGVNALLAYFMQVIMRLGFRALKIEPFFSGSSNETLEAWAGMIDWSVWQSFLLDKTGYNGLLWGLIWTGSLWLIIRVCNRRGIFWRL